MANENEVSTPENGDGLSKEASGLDVKLGEQESEKDFLTRLGLTSSVLFAHDVPHDNHGFLPGLFIIYGAAQAEKSKRLAELYKATKEVSDGNIAYTIFCEPDHRSVGSWGLALQYIEHGYYDEATDQVVKPDVMFIDSIKDIVYMKGSGAGKGGVSSDAIVRLSNLSSKLMREGRTVIAIINPSQESVIEPFYESLASNTTGVFWFASNDQGRLKSSFRRWSGVDFYERINDQPIDIIFGGFGINGNSSANAPSQKKLKGLNMTAAQRKNLQNAITNLYMTTQPKV